MQSGYSRYPFDKHKNEKWSLEHIHAQLSEDITNDKDRKELLKSQLDYIENDDDLLRVKSMMDKLRAFIPNMPEDFSDANAIKIFLEKSNLRMIYF